jgi:hypothetical protein
MKTKYLTSFKILSLLLTSTLGVLLVSCGSTQNSSYYDNDGIYSGSEKSKSKEAEQVAQNNANLAYQNYFKSKQLNAEEEIFTDVENYSSVTDSTQITAESYTSNASWGTNPTSISVNVYDSGWGFNYWNSWYAPYWGFNTWYGPYWGVGFYPWYGPHWGWGYPYYGYGYGYGSYYNGYAYNSGRRGGNYYTNGYRGSSAYSSRTNGYRGSSAYRSQYSTRNYTNSGTRFGTTRTGTRGYNTNTVNSSNPRSNQYNTSGTRNNTRNYGNTPSNGNNTYTPRSSIRNKRWRIFRR